MMLRDGSYGLIADELERVSEELTEAGEELRTDVAVFVRHRRVLQSIDQWVQIQRGLAQLLRADDIGRAIASCRPGDLAARLTGDVPAERPRSDRTQR